MTDTQSPPPNTPASEPIFNLPPLLKWISGVLILMHLAKEYFWEGFMEELAIKLVFIPARYSSTELIWYDPVASFLSPIGHTLLHFDWLHLLSNLGMFLAFGTALYRLIGPERILLIWCIGALAGVIAVASSNPTATTAMIGASDSISAVLGALIYFSWKLTQLGIAASRPFASKDRILTFIAVWVGMNLLFIIVPFGDGTRIAWEAHLAGFAAGYISAWGLYRLKFLPR